VPEGDTILRAALKLRPVLEGRVPDALVTHRRFAHDRWAERLAGRAVTAVEPHGKHLLLHFEDGLAIHSHLRMTGRWRVRAAEPAPPPRTWLAIRAGDREVLQINGPVLELLTELRARARIAGLGPDILAETFDASAFLRRLRTDDPTRPIGDALLDQSIVAGIGNVWKAEGCFAAAIDPWRRTADVSDEEALAIVAATRPRMLASAHGDRAPHAVYGAAGGACPRCGADIRARGQGDANRTTYWCPGCQR